jgi:hypothetical protein
MNQLPLKKQLEACSKFGAIGLQDRPIAETYTSIGIHPSKALNKKETTFYGDVCYVRFDRKTIPKSGKSIINNCFVENRKHYYLVWDIRTRALLGLCWNDLETTTRKYNEQFNQRTNTTST